ncbi:hypothetical protein [Microcystis phage Mel-JY01]
MKKILCSNSEPTSKYFNGKICKEHLMVDEKATGGLCWKCVASLVAPPEEKKPSEFPRGWKLFKQFVDKNGNVYHKGILQEDLFGKFEPTVIEQKEKKETKKREKKRDTLDEKIMIEYRKRINKTRKKSNKK